MILICVLCLVYSCDFFAVMSHGRAELVASGQWPLVEAMVSELRTISALDSAAAAALDMVRAWGWLLYIAAVQSLACLTGPAPCRCMFWLRVCSISHCMRHSVLLHPDTGTTRTFHSHLFLSSSTSQCSVSP